VSPTNAYGTRAIVLADGELTHLSSFDMRQFKLPDLEPTGFGGLLAWTRYPHILALRKVRSIPDIASNEVELSVTESALALAERDEEREAGATLLDKTVERFWSAAGISPSTEDAGPPPSVIRIRALLELVLNHLRAKARLSAGYAGFVTILHVLALCEGGLRRETLARVLARYAVATGATDERMRPKWQRDTEAPLWEPKLGTGWLSAPESEELCSEVTRQITSFETHAAEHIRTLMSTWTPGLDNYPHPFESPEVPPLRFNLQDPSIVLELRYPLVQRELRSDLAKQCPRKNALLQRLIADEFIRRAVIVQRHGTDRDQLSLVEKRYIIAGIFHGLNGLAFHRDRLTSREGVRRMPWLLEPPGPAQAFRWIYRWLYVEQLNAGAQELSRQHGAEALKTALLELFLEKEPESDRILRNASMRPFLVRDHVFQRQVRELSHACGMLHPHRSATISA